MVSGKIQLKEMDPETDNNGSEDDSGFRPPYAHMKKQRRKVVVGTRKDCSIKGGTQPRRDLFVYRVYKDTSAEDMKDFLGQSVEVLNCQKISHEDAINASFKITVTATDAKTMFKKDFWPTGIYCRSYIPPRESTTA
jgi:hypothetical protein